MLIYISWIVPKCTWCVDDNVLISCPVKVSYQKGMFYYAYHNLKVQDKDIEDSSHVY